MSGHETRFRSPGFVKVAAILGLLLVSLGAGFLMLETGLRLISPRAQVFSFPNFSQKYRTTLSRGFLHTYDSELGYFPTPNYRSDEYVDGVQTTVSSFGTRLHNGRQSEAGMDRFIVMVGDSFVYGTRVSDSETWPAYLESHLAMPVINGGVSGYGFDQTVLRAERLVQRFKPDILLVGWIPDDIRRTQLAKQRGAAKPYFQVVAGQLVRQNNPVPELRGKKRSHGALRDLLGYSYLFDWSVRRLGYRDWWYGVGPRRIKVHDQGPLISCLLMARLRALEIKHGVRVVQIIQYDRNAFVNEDNRKKVLKTMKYIRLCARDNDIETIDTFESMQRQISKTKASDYFVFRDMHLNPNGNKLTAEIVRRYLRVSYSDRVKLKPNIVN
jgi:hypothetical protein